MTTKIQTPIGHLSLPDERMAENASSLYKDLYHERDIPIITIISDNARKLYRTANPYGVGYTNHYSRALSSQNTVMKLTAGTPSREIDFLEIS